MPSVVQALLLGLSPATATGTLWSQTLTSNSVGWNTITGVNTIAAAAMSLPTYGITRMRFKIEAATTEGCIITNMYVGHKAASGDAYDFAATPVQVLFSGSAGVTIAISTDTWSDWCTFSYDKTTPLSLAWYISSSTDSLRQSTGLGANYNNYQKAVNEAGTVNKSASYSVGAGKVIGVNAIECDGY